MRYFKTILLIFVASLTVTLSACMQKARPTHTGLQVVTTLKVYQEAAGAVLGQHGRAVALIDNPDMDPHDYDAGTGAAKQVATADLLIMNGLGYDNWMTKLANASDKQDQLVSVASEVMGKREGDNEHVFYDPELMFRLAPALAHRFAKLDPDHAKDYRANAKRYVASLRPLKTTLQKIRQQAKGRQVAVSEPVFDNAVTAAGYQLTATAFAKSIEDGTDPAPKEVAALRRAIKTHRLAFFVNNVQADSPVIAQMVALAKREGVPIVSVRETQPAGKTYLQWMIANYEQMR